MVEQSAAQDAGAQPTAGGKRPQVIAAAEGAWAEKPRPNLQAQFRCIAHGRGTVMDPLRWRRQ